MRNCALQQDGLRRRDYQAGPSKSPSRAYAAHDLSVAAAVFVGRPLFMLDYGTARADFPGGDAYKLYRSIKRLLALPHETRLFIVSRV